MWTTIRIKKAHIHELSDVRLSYGGPDKGSSVQATWVICTLHEDDSYPSIFILLAPAAPSKEQPAAPAYIIFSLMPKVTS